jgi:hypothetical protein
MVSALTLLDTDESPDGRARWSYVLLAETLRRISESPADDARELFRRMGFDALVSNNDDHPRNHATRDQLDPRVAGASGYGSHVLCLCRLAWFSAQTLR